MRVSRWLPMLTLLASACFGSGSGGGSGATGLLDAAAPDGPAEDAPSDPGDAGSAPADAMVTDASLPPRPRFERYIRSDTDTRLILEVDAVDGFGPYPSVGADLVAGLEPLIDKPGGIEVVMDGAIESRGVDHAWTDQELADLAPSQFDLEVATGTVKMHVMFVDGHHERDDEEGRILGLAWGHTHIVLFKRTLEQSCSGGTLGPLLRERLCTNAELSVWTHEVGHNLGLVDNGLPMVNDHRDAEHGRHDVNDSCVMYWAYEGTAVVDLLRTRLTGGNEQALDFDSECMADIAAVRDR